ncbi:MAG: type IV toxin-antitoxin system AbiEi family antitoxin domain-containing protein [Acidimicrobiia bacterium]
MKELREFAADRYSVFTAADADRQGVSIDAVRRGVRSGWILRLHAGVFAFAGSPESWERSMLAACLAAGNDAVASHRSAARIWRLIKPCDDILEISVPRRNGPRPRGTIVHRSGDLVPAHTTVRNRIPTTNPLRTMVDLAAVVPPDQVEDALDAGLAWPSLFSVAAVEAMRSRLAQHGRAGTGVLRRVLEARALGNAVSDSVLERCMAELLRRAGLPAAVFHYAVCTPAGLFLAEVDFAYPEIKLAIEVDGFGAHGTPRAMAKDFVRQNGLVPYGWRVLRFTWRQVTRQPEMVAGALRAALDSLQAA